MPTPQEQHEAEMLATYLEALARTSLNAASSLRSLRDKGKGNYIGCYTSASGAYSSTRPPVRSAARQSVGPWRWTRWRRRHHLQATTRFWKATPAFARRRCQRRTCLPLVILNSSNKGRSPAPARRCAPDARRPTPDANHRPTRYHHA